MTIPVILPLSDFVRSNSNKGLKMDANPEHAARSARSAALNPTEKVRCARGALNPIMSSDKVPCNPMSHHPPFIFIFFPQELEEKERRLRANIAKNYGRIRDVERELSDLQLELHMNVEPKKHGLEMLRRKIETQSEKVSAAQRANDAAQKVAARTAEALAAEERIKDQLCQELNLLVQQSARSQLDKLEQLQTRLQSLSAGLAIADHEEVGSETLSKASQLQHNAEALRGALLVTAGVQEPHQPAPVTPAVAGTEKAAAATTAAAANNTHSTEAEEAFAARNRHVQLHSKGKARGATSTTTATGATRTAAAAFPAPRGTAPVRETRDAHGAFRGFE